MCLYANRTVVYVLRFPCSRGRRTERTYIDVQPYRLHEYVTRRVNNEPTLGGYSIVALAKHILIREKLVAVNLEGSNDRTPCLDGDGG